MSQEAVELYGELAAATRDAYLPDYTQSVTVLGYVLVQDTRFGEAIAHGPAVRVPVRYQVCSPARTRISLTATRRSRVTIKETASAMSSGRSNSMPSIWRWMA